MDSPTAQPQTESPFAGAYAGFYPLFATIELSLRCSLRCAHCYNFDRSGPAPHGPEAELQPAQVHALIAELEAEGGLEINFTGGEALLHPHLDAFIADAHARRFAVRLKSNGMHYTPERSKRLVEVGAWSTDISMYGAQAGTHEALTKVPGSFARTLEGARNARDAGLKVSLSFVLTRFNAEEVADMIALAEAEGFAYHLDPQMTKRYDGTTGSLDWRVTAEQLEALYRGPLRDQIGEGGCRTGIEDMSCSCAQAVVGISSTGEVYPCIGAPVPSGNLKDKSFREIWRESPVLNGIRGLGLENYTDCKACPDRNFCRRSSGVAFVNTGNYTAADPFACEEAAILRTIQTEGMPA